MRKKRYNALLIFICSAFLAPAQEKLVFTTGGSPQLPPAKECLSILTEAYGRLGIEIEAISLPSERALRMANSGEADGELFRGRDVKDTYPNLIKIPVPLQQGEIVVFTKDHLFEVKGWASLKPYRIGSHTGQKEVEAHAAELNIEFVTMAEQLFEKLANGRTDVVVIPRILGLTTLSEMGKNGTLDLSGIKILEPPLQHDSLYHHLHKKHAHLVPEITAVLESMIQEDRLKPEE
jgi:polar amino acid transport system substrate-binding protein